MVSTDHSQAVLADEGFHTAHADRSDRFASFNPEEFPIPRGTGEEEDWRFTPMDRVAPFIKDVEGVRDATVTATVVGGACVEEVDRSDPRLGTVGKPDDRAAALAWSAFRRAHIVTLDGSEHADVVAIINGEGKLSVAHTLITAAPEASGTVVLEHTGSGNLTETVEIEVGAHADLTVVSVQEQERCASQHSAQRIRVGEGAKFRHIVVTIGGDLIRMTTACELEGERSDSELLGAYITESHQHHEHRIFVDHVAPHCKSRATYKGALQGDEAHSVWIGDVLIRAQAAQTDTYELNRNLVLTEGAKADSVPNLEILTGDIAGAGHASATGRFDDEQLFYLMARGIPADVARRLVVRGFFAELVEQIEVDSVRIKLMDAIERELDLADAGNGEDA
ncbi:Fe-S cluster assembly protein SufD [Actinotignum timonense]|uniref:Fe-S cluster assembly protein SufD n=1 Tax=Actinotignum TaxID=1653174 RepID=UPI00237D3E71|nr:MULTISPECIES: Fe-S cluster assembly protein SufD [Actinotignum]MDE1654409.1 Fe-S cluster assembly protein SufD [Actinotignum schaalii]MDK6907329.1 Fe-S cluster assembly protein SufD [Actinotignum timonense]